MLGLALVLVLLTALGTGYETIWGSKGIRATPSRRIISLPNRSVLGPYSEGVLVGNTLYLAGRIAVDPKTGKVPGNIDEEIRLLLDDTKATLAEAQMSMDDLVSVQVFCTDLSLFNKFNGVYRSYFMKDFPARAFVGCGALLRGAHFEILGIALKQSPPSKANLE
jgi:reactive intermediate/imine deaminase